MVRLRVRTASVEVFACSANLNKVICPFRVSSFSLTIRLDVCPMTLSASIMYVKNNFCSQSSSALGSSGSGENPGFNISFMPWATIIFLTRKNHIGQSSIFLYSGYTLRSGFQVNTVLPDGIMDAELGPVGGGGGGGKPPPGGNPG